MNDIFKVWSYKNVVQGENNAGRRGHDGCVQKGTAIYGFIDSAGDIIGNTKSGVYCGGNAWDCVCGVDYGTPWNHIPGFAQVTHFFQQ